MLLFLLQLHAYIMKILVIDRCVSENLMKCFASLQEANYFNSSLQISPTSYFTEFDRLL